MKQEVILVLDCGATNVVLHPFCWTMKWNSP